MIRILQRFGEIPGIPERFSYAFSGDSEDSDEILDIFIRLFRIPEIPMKCQRFHPKKVTRDSYSDSPLGVSEDLFAYAPL